jgi:hypothetical protein
VFSAVAGGCGATAFVWAQHHGAVRRLTGSDGPGRDRWLPSLCDGSMLAGIGFAYLRRPVPRRCVRSVRMGWRLEGAAPWITGWGLADLFVIMARADDGSVVTVVVDDPYERPELTPGPRQRLAVMGSTGTVSLRFDGLEIAEGSVAAVQPSEAWERRDRIGSAMPSAAPLGIAERAIDLLAGKGEASPLAADAAVASARSWRSAKAAPTHGGSPGGRGAMPGSSRCWIEVPSSVTMGLDLARRNHRCAGRRRRRGSDGPDPSPRNDSRARPPSS